MSKNPALLLVLLAAVLSAWLGLPLGAHAEEVLLADSSWRVTQVGDEVRIAYGSESDLPQ